jgi:tungstate transport system ATP-binding protein
VGAILHHQVALRPLKLTLHQGDRLALVGANGSGKTTLLRLLMGSLPPSQGERTLTRPLRCAMVFQQPHLLRTCVLRNITLALRLQGWSAAHAEPRARHALHRVGLSELAHRPANQLSGGQRQRLAIARAWACQPDVLLLDEPTAALDPQARRDIETLLLDMAADALRPLTLVWASHHLGEVRRLATRVAYLERSQMLADLPAAAFFNPALLAQQAPAAHAFVQNELFP